MISNSQDICLNQEQCNIINTLIYFDVFSYPITLSELHQFIQNSQTDINSLEKNVTELCNKQLITKIDTYYGINNSKALVETRIKGNNNAQKHATKAFKNALLIGAFPYVRGVYISGSFSKGYMDESGDIDYFIITHPNRLWIARTLLILYKKIFLLNSRKYFCVNYFIDTDNLEIPDKNIFTATEVLTLIPGYNQSLFETFLNKNSWTTKHLPQKNAAINSQSINKNTWLKNGTEKLLNNKIGEWMDDVFMRITIAKWKRKFKHLEHTNFELALRSRKYVSKHHPQNFQWKVLKAIEEKSKAFEQKFNVKLAVPVNN